MDNKFNITFEVEMYENAFGLNTWLGTGVISHKHCEHVTDYDKPPDWLLTQYYEMKAQRPYRNFRMVRSVEQSIVLEV